MQNEDVIPTPPTTDDVGTPSPVAPATAEPVSPPAPTLSGTLETVGVSPLAYGPGEATDRFAVKVGVSTLPRAPWQGMRVRMRHVRLVVYTGHLRTKEQFKE